MSKSLSPDTQAILLLTAPLIAGRVNPSSDLLTPGEYRRLALFLRDKHCKPADLLASDARELLAECQHLINCDRLTRLLSRGFLLSQAVDHWQTRAIWVVSCADADYPERMKAHLKEYAPPVLYGCGEVEILNTGGLAVVGSRNVNDALIDYAERIGKLAAQAGCTLVSGGARGIDQAAMRGALYASGMVAGVLADSLERAALNREYRNHLMNGQLVLLSPYDPSAIFNAGNAMQRNKLIYALADAALAVSSDCDKGGTWTGAVEQLEKLRFVPVYVRSNGETCKGLEALQLRGALPWPEPKTPEALAEVFGGDVSLKKSAPPGSELFSSVSGEAGLAHEIPQSLPPVNDSFTRLSLKSPPAPADELFARVRELLWKMNTPRTDAEIACDLNVSKSQAKEWLQRLVREGVLEKYTRPVRYGPKSQRSLL
jgi:DNA processing protein